MSLTIRRWHIECYRRAAVRTMQPESVFPRQGGDYIMVVYNPPHDERVRHRRLMDSYNSCEYIYHTPLCMFR